MSNLIIEKIYIDIKNYFDNENNISYILKSGEIRAFFKGYLIRKEWVDKQKKYSNYENIKHILNTNDEAKIKNLIRIEQSRNNLNYDDLKIGIENYIINVYYLSNRFSVLLNTKFLNSFINTSHIKPTEFFLSDQTISINFKNGKELKFKTNSNIIFNHNFRRYYSENLKHLIRIIYLKRELIQPNLKFKSMKSAYLINKQIIDKFRQIYNIDELFGILENKNLLNGITYKNCDNNYRKIYDLLNEEYYNFIEEISKKEKIGTISFNIDDIIFKAKYINNQPNLSYIDNFEIIDPDFYNFLKQKFGEDLLMHQAYYAPIEDKIFLIICFNQTYIYEIISFSPKGGDIIIEYLIEVLLQIREKTISYDINELNYSIFKFLSFNGLKKLISTGNSITNGKNFSLKFHPINNPLGKNIISDNIIAVNFKTSDQTINFPVGAINTDKFAVLEEKLYLEFPQLRNKNVFFLCNGNKIYPELTLEQNKIKSGSSILICNIY